MKNALCQISPKINKNKMSSFNVSFYISMTSNSETMSQIRMQLAQHIIYMSIHKGR